MNTDAIHVPAASFIHPLVSVVERLDLGRMFPQAQPLEIELGSGDGSFLSQYAGRHRERNFIGVERLLGRLRKLDRKSIRLGLSNVRAVRIEAGYFLEHLLPSESAEALHIYFPDPWPKRRHHKHRLINERFPSLARQALAEGGVVYLRTDDAAYFAQMKEVFAACDAFAETPTPEELAGTLTDFERGFLAKGIQTLRAAFRKIKHQ
ncbi:MAG TPA: tRNA (guanosine(46)-N7)-methyltransferase TrmB [Verrucomicrobiae bacterium]|nr:tRNA (guanosine(46)-N7)-methyltransferase TrmB [Verrucomicrobiae bacterium]